MGSITCTDNTDIDIARKVVSDRLLTFRTRELGAFTFVAALMMPLDNAVPVVVG